MSASAGRNCPRRCGLEQSQLRTPERLARLLLVMSLALYFAVSTGLWDAATNPTVDEKKPQASARQPSAQQAILVHPRHSPHRQAATVPPANPTALVFMMKLMGGEPELLAAGHFGNRS